jgi:serine kinase of HPr protein (carbohydrate metabolism regulator)
LNSDAPLLVHGTAIAFGERAVLLRGASGAGKSDVALRLLALPEGGIRSLGIEAIGPVRLVGDDQVSISRRGEALVVSSPDTIRGRFEVRGIGIVTIPVAPAARLALVVDLVDGAGVERMPQETSVRILDRAVPLYRFAAFEATAPLKILFALAAQG